MTQTEFTTRAELERALDRVEGRMEKKQDAILAAVRDLKTTMNGQFWAQGELLRRHESQINVLNDRSGRDNTARIWAGLGGAIALLASYFGLKAP